ncbi:hypothetical protein ACOSP7_020534 [Xanthoceras sorbifolium]
MYCLNCRNGAFCSLLSLPQGPQCYSGKTPPDWNAQDRKKLMVERSRADWLRAGDKNSKFFHMKASARQKKNTIRELIDENGMSQTDAEGINRTVCKYFSSVFTSNNPSDLASNFIECKMNSDMLTDLNAPFEDFEVKQALFNLGSTKAPRPDGFYAIFFQKNWDVVGGYITNVCLRVLNGSLSIKDFNSTNVALIPKIKNPLRMNEFRPISLCSVVYKTVTKAIANRLKPLLPNLISSSQSAFVPGRLIFDNVLIAFEMLHSINKRKKGKRGFAALKLDMSTAYNCVKWRFLKKVLEKLGFPNKFIALIWDCISTSSFSFVVNGNVVGKVFPSKGLRQGYPLSPYLFLFCVEAFSAMIHGKAQREGPLGFRCCRGNPPVSHLFFADDSVLFCRVSKANGAAIKRILKIYEEGFGQQINFLKSSVSYSPNVNTQARLSFQNMLGLSGSSSYDKYLGLPTLIGRNKKQVFNAIKERVWKRLKSWKGSFFSMGGKEVLIKAIDQAVPTYTMSLFQIPSSLCKDLTSLISGFWWGFNGDKRKMSWAS